MTVMRILLHLNKLNLDPSAELKSVAKSTIFELSSVFNLVDVFVVTSVSV